MSDITKDGTTNGGGERSVRAAVFTVGGVEYAVTGRVPRSLPAARPLPAAVDHDGREFPVVDLPALFGFDGAAADGAVVEGGGADGGGEPLLLLVEQGGLRRALVVDGLAGLETLDHAELQPVPEVYPPAERRRWQGLLPRPDGRVLVVPRLEELSPAAGGGRE